MMIPVNITDTHDIGSFNSVKYQGKSSKYGFL